MDAVTKALMTEFARTNQIESLPQSEQFEYFSTYSILSSRYSDSFDVSELISGGGNDLCIDAFAVIVNGRIATDGEFVEDILDMNRYLDVEFIIIQSKTTSGFDGSEILALGENLRNEVFSDSQKLPFNEDISRLIEIKKRIYENASKLHENPILRVYYVTTGIWNDDKYIKKITSRKRTELYETNMFSDVIFEPVGAKTLQDLYRNTKKAISREVCFEKLVTLPGIRDVTASYLGVLPSTQFIKLITDEDNNIVRSVFVDNVRDFQGENDVNRDIAQTISEGAFDQFVLRNNGITIVAKKIKVTSSQFTLTDYQIVNGCQTSHVIYANRDDLSDDLLIPVKLIHTESEEVSQSVIKSTNKQTPVDENDLLALTKFQRDLEDYYTGMEEDCRLYYERRAKQYATRTDIEKGRITSIGSQLKSYASMFIELPHQAGRYQGTLLKAVKDQVFRSNHRPESYYTSAFTAYRFEVAIRRLAGDDRKIRPFRFFLLLAFRHRYEKFDFPGSGNRNIASYCKTLNEILQDQAETKAAFEECKSVVEEALSRAGLDYERDSAKTRSLVVSVTEVARGRNPAVA